MARLRIVDGRRREAVRAVSSERLRSHRDGEQRLYLAIARRPRPPRPPSARHGRAKVMTVPGWTATAGVLPSRRRKAPRGAQGHIGQRSRGLDVLAGIHDPFGVEDALDLLHESQGVRAAMGFELLAEQGDFLTADPMLTRHAPADADRVPTDLLEGRRCRLPAVRVRL